MPFSPDSLQSKLDAIGRVGMNSTKKYRSPKAKSCKSTSQSASKLVKSPRSQDIENLVQNERDHR